MPRYLYRVQYTYPDESVSYEPVALDAADEAAALVEVTAATERYAKLMKATRTYTRLIPVPA